MSLVNYSDSSTGSESESELVSSPPRKKLARPSQSTANTTSASLPPLPTSFHSLYASSTRVSTNDDPSLHAGRKRAIPHVEGNWPTHLYLEWVPGKEELRLLTDLIQATETPSSPPSTTTPFAHNQHEKLPATTLVHSLLHTDLGAQLPLHISLSRPVILRTEQRAAFAETLAETLRSSSISPFTVTPQTLKWVSNYEKTRWFLVLRVSRPKENNLNRLLSVCNSALRQFGQPPLYVGGTASENEPGSEPDLVPTDGTPKFTSPGNEGDAKGLNEDYSHCFHISIAWRLNAPDYAEMERVRARSLSLDKVRDIGVSFDCVKAKIGNYVETFQL